MLRMITVFTLLLISVMVVFVMAGYPGEARAFQPATPARPLRPVGPPPGPLVLPPPPGVTASAPLAIPEGPAVIVIQLAQPSLLEAVPGVMQDAATVEEGLDLLRTERARLFASQQALIVQLTAPPYHARILGTTILLSNTIIVEVDALLIPQIQQLPNVARVRIDRIGQLHTQPPGDGTPPPLGQPGLGPVLD